MKNLSLGVYRTFSGAKLGLDRTFFGGCCFQKGGFGECNVPGPQELDNEGTKTRNDGTKNRNEGTLAKTTLLQNLSPFWGGRGFQGAVLKLPLLEAHKPTQHPEIPKKNCVYANFFENFARNFAFFPVTRVRNTTEIVQKKNFSNELFYFGWIFSGGLSCSNLRKWHEHLWRGPFQQGGCSSN